MATRKKAPYGFRWTTAPGGYELLTADLRTKKGKELLRKAREIISRPETNLDAVFADLESTLRP